MRMSLTKLKELEQQAKIFATGELFSPKRIGIFSTSGDLLHVQDAFGSTLAGVTYDTKLCEVFLPLFDEKLRYVSLRGGRGSGKSTSVAKALLLMGAQKKLRILCFREVQNSIKDSVFMLLKDEIEKLGLSDFYSFTTAEIRGLNGTLFIFRGLSDMTADSIKSMQGIDIAWGEEAATLTERSLTTFIPTIRNDGSRIFFTWNPELDTDEVYQRYVVNPPEDCESLEVNWSDNPWFPEVLEKERVQDEKRWPASKYNNVWGGKVLPAVSGAIYFDEVEKAQEDGRIQKVSYDPKLKVHAVFDLGWTDATAIILVQKTLTELRIINYIEASKLTYEDINKQLRALPYSNWGKLWLPHDARHGNQATGQTPEEQFKAFGWEVEITPQLGIEYGITAARQIFDRIYFDKQNTERLVECLKRYRRIQKPNGAFGTPLHDMYSHGADAFRYLGVVTDRLQNASAFKNAGPINYRNNSVYG